MRQEQPLSMTRPRRESWELEGFPMRFDMALVFC